MALAVSGMKRLVTACMFQVAVACVTTPADAQDRPGLAGEIEVMRNELASQRSLIESQSKRLEQQQREIERLGQAVTTASTGQAEHHAIVQATPTSQPEVVLPSRPVGDAPELLGVEQQIEALPVGMGVLTRPGRFVVEPSFEYTNSSNNRLVFRGIELIPGIQLGLIEASDADRDTLVTTTTVRYGLSNRLEFEARVPYLIRSDRVEGVQQRQDTNIQSAHLSERHIGDVEFALRYQFNRPVGQRPIFVGSLRIKTDTGKSPFSVPFDEAGVATGLATGSGFWAVQPGLSFLLPSDPVVIFGGVGYLYHIARNVDRAVGGIMIGRVDPGDAISGNIGFGFALNNRFSFSLAYQHNYILPMRWTIGDTSNRSRRLQVGSFSMGMSYRLTDRLPLNFSVDLGATEAAPDVSIVLRTPLSLN